MPPRASILCPTYNHGELLKLAVQGVLHQSETDWELFILGDGVDANTRRVVEEVLTWDSRIHFIDREKSERHGEPYRHELLQSGVVGENIFYLADDDLWLPQHLERMLPLLEQHDMVHSRACRISIEGEISTHYANWEDPHTRDWLLSEPRKNSVGLSQAAHRLDFYKQLPYGWRTTPQGEWSDHYMWKQMFAQPEVRPATSWSPTCIQFPSPQRLHMSLEERYAEMESFLHQVQLNPEAFLIELTQQVESAEKNRVWSLDQKFMYFKDLAQERLEIVKQIKTTSQERLEIIRKLKVELATHSALLKASKSKLKDTQEALARRENQVANLSKDLALIAQLDPHHGDPATLDSAIETTSLVWPLKERWISIVRGLKHAKLQQAKLSQQVMDAKQKAAASKQALQALTSQHQQIPHWIRKWFRN